MTSEEDIAHLALRQGKISLKGQFVLGYNYTFLASLLYQGEEYLAVYKPMRGEQPLSDFPANTLAQREVAAYLVCQGLGWDFVPVTILRDDGPLGAGSLQKFIAYDLDYHYFNFSPADRQRLRPVALFDQLNNNADRKGGHILIEQGTDHLWLIDHGLCFHEEEKLRTVIWDFAGEDIPTDMVKAIALLRDNLARPSKLHKDLEYLLSRREIDAILSRAESLLTSGKMPQPPKDRRAFPYPPI